MKAVYVHISPQRLPVEEHISCNLYTFSELPQYAKFSLEQSERFLQEKSILVDDEYVHDVLKEEVKDFFRLCKINFPSFYKNPFWLTTLLRLYIAQLFCEKNNIEEFIHLEYDNLIYSDLSALKSLCPSLYFTRVGPFYSSAGFVYCNSLKQFNCFIERIKLIVSKGEKEMKKFTKDPNLSEMAMIDLIYKHTKQCIDYLPILPEGIGNDNFELLKCLFDGASYGQFIGGTNAGDPYGWYGLHHYTGMSIHNRKIFPYFDRAEKKPYVIFGESRIPISNLHVHSKKLSNFI